MAITGRRDDIGDRLTRASGDRGDSPDPRHRPASVTTRFGFTKAFLRPAYDDDGNLTGDGHWLYSWDAEPCDRIGSI